MSYVIYVHGLEVESTNQVDWYGFLMIHVKDSRLGPPGYTLKNMDFLGFTLGKQH